MNVMPGEGENGEDLVGIGRCGRAEAACPISVGAVSPWQSENGVFAPVSNHRQFYDNLQISLQE